MELLAHDLALGATGAARRLFEPLRERLVYTHRNCVTHVAEVYSHAGRESIHAAGQRWDPTHSSYLWLRTKADAERVLAAVEARDEALERELGRASSS